MSSPDLADLSSDLSATLSLKSSPPLSSTPGYTTPTPQQSGRDSPSLATPDAFDYELEHGPGAALDEEVGEEAETMSTVGGVKRGYGNGTMPGQRGRAVDPSERRTVFLPNLPRSASSREVSNLCAFAEGFLKAQVYDSASKEGAGGVGRDGQIKSHLGAFLLFEHPSQAVAAKERLHGFVFDGSVVPPVVLQARLALKNLFLSAEESAALSATTFKSSRRGSAVQGGVIPAPENSYAFVAAGGQFSPQLLAQQQQQLQPTPFQMHSGYHSPALSPMPNPYVPQSPNHSYAANAYYNAEIASGATSPQHAPQQQPQQQQQMTANGVFAGAYANAGYNHARGYSQHNNGGGYHHSQSHSHGERSHSHSAGPWNPPCTTLFLARLESLSNEELFQLLVNSFPNMRDHKFMIDSKQNRIAFVEFDSIESASIALQRINGYLGLACAFSKNPLNVRK